MFGIACVFVVCSTFCRFGVFRGLEFGFGFGGVYNAGCSRSFFFCYFSVRDVVFVLWEFLGDRRVVWGVREGRGEFIKVSVKVGGLLVW